MLFPQLVADLDERVGLLGTLTGDAEEGEKTRTFVKETLFLSNICSASAVMHTGSHHVHRYLAAPRGSCSIAPNTQSVALRYPIPGYALGTSARKSVSHRAICTRRFRPEPWHFSGGIAAWRESRIF